MKIHRTSIHDAYLVEPEHLSDARGYFARIYCEKEFRAAGIPPKPWVQINISFSKKRGTVRGLHYQHAPAEERKYVTCMRGAIYDAIVDIRPDSPTYLKSYGVELTEDDNLLLFVPEGCVHGFQTLRDDSLVVYHMSEYYAPDLEGSYRYDDPAFGIQWPLEVTELSGKDAAAPSYQR